MNLTKEEAGYVKYLISKGEDFEEILKSEFSTKLIFVVYERDNLSNQLYAENAFFDEKKAHEYMDKISSNQKNNPKNTYHIVAGTIQDLERGRILDEVTKKSLGNINKMIIYNHLEENLDNF